jgi:cobyrinic acid a,c-diamide synthase
MVLKALIDYCGITFPVVFVVVFNEVNESLASVFDGFSQRFHVVILGDVVQEIETHKQNCLRQNVRIFAP